MKPKWVILALACISVLIITSSADQCGQQGIVGKWPWDAQQGYTVEINEDHSIRVYNDATGATSDEGTWNKVPLKDEYMLHWNKGPIDTLTLSSNCQHLDGYNQYNTHVTADKIPGEPFEDPSESPSGRLSDPNVDGKSKIESLLQGDSGPLNTTCHWNSFTPDQRAFIGQPGGVLPLDKRITEGSYLIHVGPAGKFGLGTPATWNTFGPYNLRGGHKYRALIKSGPAGSSAGTSLPIDLQWDEDTADLLPYSNTEPGIARVYARNNVEGDIFYAICLTSAAGTGYPDLSGTWYMRGPYNVGMPCKISQEGSTLTFVNENGARSAGKFLDAKTVIATDWQNGLHGTISADGTRIDWANGTWWTR